MAKRFPIRLAITVGHPAMIGTGPLGRHTPVGQLVGYVKAGPGDTFVLIRRPSMPTLAPSCPSSVVHPGRACAWQTSGRLLMKHAGICCRNASPLASILSPHLALAAVSSS